MLSLMGITNGSYVYTRDLQTLESHHPTTPPHWCTPCPSPLILDHLQRFMDHHPDKSFAAYVLNGLHNGFHIGFSRSSLTRSTYHNHPSSQERPEVIDRHIIEELRLGRLVGPLPMSHTSQVQVSPIGLVPKPHSDKWRLVVDLSFPRGHSVNDGICPTLCSLRYASVDNAVDIIMSLGRSTALVKLDLSNAYRIVPVHPDDQPLLGIRWNNLCYIDRALPFGLRSAPKIFNSVADSLAWALRCEGIPFLLHYLDDFLLLGPPDSILAASMRSTAERVFRYLGVPLANHKSEGPTSVLTFLGIQIDTNLSQLSLPTEKVARLQQLLHSWRSRKCCTRRDLECLLGHLSHAATVIRPGRIFLRSLFSLMSRVTNPSHFIRLNMESRTDIAWWRCLLDNWNGQSFFPPSSPSCHLYSDASGSYGCGAYGPDVAAWFQLQWPDAWNGVGIASKELVPIVIAAVLWGPRWASGHVCFHCDNEAVVSVIENRQAHHPLLRQLLRCLFFYAVIYKFHFSARHIPGAQNSIADAISRNKLDSLSSLIPQAVQVSIPPAISAFLLAPPEWGSPSWIVQFCHSLPRAFPLPLPTVTDPGSAAT